jgi:2-isopropylmalate synthase
VSELAGRSTLTLKANELGLDLGGPALGELLETLKRMEHEGSHFEVAAPTLEVELKNDPAGRKPGLPPAVLRPSTTPLP